MRRSLRALCARNPFASNLHTAASTEDGRTAVRAHRDAVDAKLAGRSAAQTPVVREDAKASFRDTRPLVSSMAAPDAITGEMPKPKKGSRPGDIVLTPQQDDALRRRLIYQSRYRGMSEMDLIFGAFANEFVSLVNPATGAPNAHVLDPTGLSHFDAILRELDSEMHHFLVDLAVCGGGADKASKASRASEAKATGMVPTAVGDEGDVVPARLLENPIWPVLVEFVKESSDSVLKFR
jgi:succinate dehydrogenase flavin-adding protein (antitoxin of CptAB toxin-antitoxin module)